VCGGAPDCRVPRATHLWPKFGIVATVTCPRWPAKLQIGAPLAGEGGTVERSHGLFSAGGLPLTECLSGVQYTV